MPEQSSQGPSSDPGDTRQSRLAALLADYMDRFNSGETIDEDEIRRAHSDLAAELINDLRTLRQVGSKGNGGDHGVLGDYKLLRRVGRGGMGVVYEAWQGSMDRRVALKVLPAGLAADDRAFHRFMREAKTAGKLNHLNVVSVFGLGIEANTPYYAMEFVDGETLAQVLAGLKNSPPEARTPFGFPRDDVAYYSTLARCFADVADGLQHAHSRGVIHRDIKPSNLILDREGRLRILDFGLARLEGQESLTLTGDFLGTVLYMSPEQAMAKRIPIDHRTDIYSLGATMYELLALKPPFQGKNPQDTLSQIIVREPPPLRNLNPAIPRDLETIVLKCLRKDPGGRFNTAEALAQDLRRFMRGDPVEARPPTAWERTWRRAWRQRLRLAATGTVVLVVLLASAIGTMLWQRRGEERLARYEELVGAGIDGLEVGLLTSSGELDEGETLALGILHPYDVQSRSAEKQTSVDKAVESLRAAVALLPDRPEAWVHLSGALWAVGERQESEEVLNDALERESGFVPGLLLKAYRLREAKHVELAEALERVLDAAADEPWEHVWLEAHRAARRGDWDAVDRSYTELLRGAARPFAGFEKELRLKRGRVALKRGQHLRAQRDFAVVRESSRGAIGPALLLGAAYYHADQRDEAAAVIEEALSQVSSADARIAAADLYRHFGEIERAREALERIVEEPVRLAALVDVLLAEGKPLEAVESGQKAIAMGFDEPWAYATFADALFGARRLEEARVMLEGAMKKYADDRAVAIEYGVILYYLCEYDELIAHCEKMRERDTTRLGWAYYRKGDLEKAIEEFTHGIARYPRSPADFLGRSLCHWFLKDFEHSVADVVRLAAVDPTRFEGIALCRVYSHETRHFFEPYWSELERIAAAAVRRGIAAPRFLGFRALACIYGPTPDPNRALELARESVRKAEGRGVLLAEALGYLAEVEAERGDLSESVRSLERAVELPLCWRWAADNLRRYREQLLPRLASCRSLDELFDGEWKIAEPSDALAAAALSSPELAGYLEVRQRENHGQDEIAAEALEALVKEGPLKGDESAILRLARLYARLGEAEDALQLLETRCLREDGIELRPWIEWIRIASADAKLGIGAMTERLRSLVPKESPPQGLSSAADVVWALVSLQQTGHIRINCGGKDYKDAVGRQWGRDRFFTGGETYELTRPPLRTDKDHELYYPHRSFWEGSWATPGYRIPLPAGRYELVLRFCMTSPRPRPMRLCIEVEGKVRREPFDPIALHGFAAPFEERFEVEVTDGALDVVFPSIRSEASVNALEVRRLD